MNELAEKLKSIWKEIIEPLYNQGLINTERVLQAELYRQLKKNEDINVWVEPVLHNETMNKIHHKKPDLLITSGREVIGIIELKYNPVGEVEYKDDITKLFEFSCLPADIKFPLLTLPETGEWSKKDEDLFSVSNNVLAVFAVIARHNAWALYPNKWENMSLPSNFLHLTGIIGKDNPIFN